MNTFNTYNSCFRIYNYNTVSGEASLATGYATVFNVCIAGVLAYHDQLPFKLATQYCTIIPYV
jgi:hypothetical protein